MGIGRTLAEPSTGRRLPIVYLDALYVKLRREGRVENVAVYVVLGHWIGDGAEGAEFWLMEH